MRLFKAKILDNKIILLIPIYNPIKGWENDFIHGYTQFQSQIDESVKVVIINDGSTTNVNDGVVKIQDVLGNELLYLSYENNKGKGAALKYGINHSQGSAYMFTDVDFPYTVESMLMVWESFKTHRALVTGHRSISYNSQLSIVRKCLHTGLRIFNKKVLGLPVYDTQCGLKAFDREVADIFVKCTTDRFLIDLEVLLAVHKAGLKITPVDVVLRPNIIFTSFRPAIFYKEVTNLVKLFFRYRLF